MRLSPDELAAIREAEEVWRNRFPYQPCSTAVARLLEHIDAVEREYVHDKSITAAWCKALQRLCDLVPDDVHLGECITGCVEPIEKLVRTLTSERDAARRQLGDLMEIRKRGF